LSCLGTSVERRHQHLAHPEIARIDTGIPYRMPLRHDYQCRRKPDPERLPKIIPPAAYEAAAEPARLLQVHAFGKDDEIERAAQQHRYLFEILQEHHAYRACDGDEDQRRRLALGL